MASTVPAEDTYQYGISEKKYGGIEHNEVGVVNHKPSDPSLDEEYLNAFTPEQQRKIIHRIDRRLVTTVGVMYCISLMDRTNLSAAAIAGYGVRNPG